MGGGSPGFCSTTNKLIMVDAYKGNCSSTPILTTTLNHCINTSPQGFAHWSDLRHIALLDSISANDTFYLKVYGSTSLGYSFGMRWLNDLPHNDSCNGSDTVVGPVTYGDNYFAGPQTYEDSLRSQANYSSLCENYPFSLGHPEILNPVYFTLLPTSDSFSISALPISCDGYPFFRLFVFKDCAHMGDYAKDIAGNYNYFLGCSDTAAITIRNVQPGIPLILRVDINQGIAGDFDLRTGNTCIFKILGSGIVMPLSLTAFNARYSEVQHNVCLTWTTEATLPQSKFIIERSDDGSRFYAIGEIKSKDNKNESEYLFYDMGYLAGKIYYRLKLVHENGKYSYSKLAVVNIEKKSLTRVYPNPAHNLVNAVIDAASKEDALVVIISVDGETVLNKKFSLINGRNILPIHLASFSNGSYFMKIKTVSGNDSIHKLTVY